MDKDKFNFLSKLYKTSVHRESVNSENNLFPQKNIELFSSE